jgi:hypothetical protein
MCDSNANNVNNNGDRLLCKKGAGRWRSNRRGYQTFEDYSGIDACTVGFVPWVQSRLPQVVKIRNKFCIVQELHHISSSNYKRKKGEKN